MEPRYQAVVAVVQNGWKFVEVAEHFGVSPQDHRAKGGGLSGADASRCVGRKPL
jgi:hypothetical protein